MTEWNVEQAKDEIANGGRYGAKRVMEEVYRNNIDVFRHWGYRLPDGRLAQRLSPRRKNSHWTERNQERCRELEQRGLMTEAGRKTLIQANNKGPNR